MNILAFMPRKPFIPSSDEPDALRKFYVSADGNDANDGLTKATAWKTISKVNASTLLAGDAVLFRRGDTFYGGITAPNVGRAGSPVIYGAYGAGAKPVITGFIAVTSWTDKGGNIWESAALPALSDVKKVLINGVDTPVGRYPKGDASYPFLPNFYKFQTCTGTGTGASSITSDSLDGVTDWTGADVVIRVNQWAFHREVIESQTGSTLNFTGLGGGLTAGWGFFIQNDIKTLTQQGDWYYNPVTNKLSIYSSAMPTDVKVSSVETLFYLYSNIPAVNSTNIDNINFTGANTNAIWISGNLTFSVTNCDVSYSGLEGMLLYGGGIQGGTVDNNTFYRNGSSGIMSMGGVNAVVDLTVINNKVDGSGMVSVYKQDDYSSAGIHIYAPGSLIQYNKVENSAYCGIVFSGNDIQVLNNFVTHSALVRADAAGIYTGWANQTGKVIDGNIILNSMGNKRGTLNNDLFAFGIYSDDLGTDIQITNNTVANCVTGGIYIHNSNNLSVDDNTIYNCGPTNSADFGTTWANGGIAIDGNADIYASSLYGNEVEGNIVFATNPYQRALWYYSAESGNDIGNFGTIDNNYYVKLGSTADLVKNRQAGVNQEISLAQWRTFSGQDINTQESPEAITDLNNIRFEYNDTKAPRTIVLDGNYIDVKSSVYDGAVTLAPFSSVVLIINS